MARKSSSPRSLELMRQWGWFYWGVEKYNAFSGKKSDLYHIIDYVVITPSSTIGVQTCGSDFSSHIQKISVDEIENTIKWLECDNRKLILIGWRKLLKRKGLKQKVYKPRIAWFYIEDGQLIVEEKDMKFYGQKTVKRKP